MIQEIINTISPKHILEIGFLVGHSSLMWLTFSNARIFSIDAQLDPGALEAAKILGETFPERFTACEADIWDTDEFIRKCKVETMATVHAQPFDLLFMDAGLGEEARLSLIAANELKIPYLAFDCWGHTRYTGLLEKEKIEGTIEHIINVKTVSTTTKIYRNKGYEDASDNGVS
jgi:hypothetical protein